MYRILLVLLLLVSSFVIAQQTPGEKTIESYNFGTLETKSGPFNAKAGGATTYHNLDPSRRLGSLNKRWGYSAIDELNDGFDSLTGIYSAYLSDGRQFLVYAADSAGVGYGGLYITVAGSDSISNGSRFWKYWSPTTPTTFSMFDDKLYAMNGVQAGVMYNFDTRKAIRFPIQAPGEPVLTPLDDGTELDGEYRYMVRVADNNPYNVAWYGLVTAPVRVSSGRVMLSGFQMNQKDTFAVGGSSMSISVYRTMANPGRLERTDSLFRIGIIATIDSGATLRQTIFIDSIHDSLLLHDSTAHEWNEIIAQYGLDSTNTYSGNLYGAPAYMTRKDSLYTAATTSGKTGGIYHGMPKGIDTVGVFYACTFLDTLNNIESDTGRSLFVSNDSIHGSAGRHWWIRMALPKLGDSIQNTVVNLYRSHRIVVGRDTTILIKGDLEECWASGEERCISQWRKWVDEQNQKAGYELYRLTSYINNADRFKVIMQSVTSDTVLNTPYYLVEQITPDSAYYTDSLRYDSLVQRDTYRKTPPSTRLTQPFAYNSRMFGIDGSNLAWSLVDSASRWGAFDFISVNKDDGQRITLAYPTRRSIRVLKDASSYNVYQDGGGNWNLAEVTNGIGCIAPNSHAVSPAGHYYLSQDGVILETEGDFLERTYKTGLISANLDNFDKLPMSAKSKAVGTYFNHKYFLTVPIAGANDTTYVWDELAQGWATWSMPVGGAAIYDTESVAGYAPGNSLYFYYPNGKELYKYGNSLTDAGAYIWSNWTSTPFLTDEYEEAVSAIGVWFDDISSGDFIRFYDIVDGRDTVRSNLALFTDLGDTVGYREEAVASLRTGAYHQLAMWSTPDASGTWSRIDKINVSYLPLGKRTRFGETTAFVGGESGEGGAGTITFGDITGVIAGYGLSGGGLSGDVTLTADTSVLATRAFARDSAGIGVVPDSVLYADSSGYADTAGVALNGGSTDSFYVAEATSTTTGWKQSGDTIFVDTSSGGSVDSFYVAQGDTTVIGWKQSGDTIFIDTTGGVGGGMSMDSTTAGNGLIEVSNDLAVRPGFGIDTVGDLVRIDTTETVTLYRLEDTAAAVRANIRDTVNAMGIIDSTTGGNGLIESANVLAVRPGFGIDTANDLVRVDFTDLDDTLPRYARIRDTAALMIEDSLDNYTLLTDFGKITDDSTNWNTVYTDYNTGGWETGDIAANTLDTSDMAHAPLGKLIYDSVAARGFLTSETGDIEGVTAGNGLGGGGTSGAVTVYANPSTTIDTTGDSIFVKDLSITSGKLANLSVTTAKIDTTGVTNNYVLKKTSTGATWAAQDALTDFTDIYGTLRVHGQIPIYNDGNDPDIYSLVMQHGDTNIYKGHMLPYYMRNAADTNAAGLRTDSLDFVHPSGFYDPNMTFGWKMIVSFTGYDEPNVIEDPFIRVSNDGVNWYRFKKLDSLVVDSCAIDSFVNDIGPPVVYEYVYAPCYDSFFTEASDTILRETDFPDSIAYYTGTKYAVKYLSDNELIHGHDGNVHLYIRASAVDASENLKSSAIYHIQSPDMITWSDTSRCIDWYDGQGYNFDMLSPSVFLGSNQSYNMLAIHTSEVSGGASPDSISYILRWRSNHPDTGWVFVDTVRDSLGVSIKFGKNSESRLENDAYAWHMDVIDWGADAKIVLIVAKYKIAAGTGFDMYVGKTRDDGVTMEIRKDPILRCATSDPTYSSTTTAWDKAYIYKATGWRINKGNRTILQIPYSAMQGTTNPVQGFHSGMGEAEFMNWSKLDFTEVAGRRNAPTDSLILTFPSWADSTGLIDRWVDSTSKTSGSGTTLTDYVMMRTTVSDPFLLDTLVLSNYITTDSGTGRGSTNNVYIDSIVIHGPDLSSGTNSADSIWWSSGTNRVADTRTTTKIALNVYQLAPAGSVFKITFINKLVAAKSAIHMERVAIKGRER